MALIHIGFFSETLGMQASCDVVLPQNAARQIGMASAAKKGGHPVLWLLHGASDDHTIWQRRTSIERSAAPLGLSVVMPAVQLSSYANMAHGGRFYDYIAKELPEKMRGFFPLSPKREDNFIAGLSMGGAGCMKIGLANPENYAAIGCFSASMPTHMYPRNRAGMEKRMEMVFGDREIAGTEEDSAHSVEMILKNKLPAPRIFHSCGVSDFLIDRARQTRDFFTAIEGNPFEYTYEEHPGAHTWEYWDEHIQRFLRFIRLAPLESARE
jgi:S-formylglutathione hydrolase FrmB